MSIRFTTLAVLAAIVGTGHASAAQGQMYVRGDLGYVFGQDETLDGDIFSPGDHDVGTDGGWRGGAAFGYLVEDDLRVEAEVSYSSRDTDNGQLFGAPLPTVAGDITTWMVTANLVYDIPHKFFGAQPFISAGAGWISVDASYISNDAATIETRDRDTQAVGKLAAGLAYPVANNVEATLTYQFAETFNELHFPTGPAASPVQGTFASSYRENSVSVGVRYTF